MHHNTPQSVTSCTKRVFSQHVALLFLIVIDATRASVLSNCTLPVDIQLSRACSTTGTKLKVSLLCGCSVRRNWVQTKLKGFSYVWVQGTKKLRGETRNLKLALRKLDQKKFKKIYRLFYVAPFCVQQNNNFIHLAFAGMLSARGVIKLVILIICEIKYKKWSLIGCDSSVGVILMNPRELTWTRAFATHRRMRFTP